MGLVPAVAAALLSGCEAPERETLTFTRGATTVEVSFMGEVTDDALFGSSASLLDQVRPIDEAGLPRTDLPAARPGWLSFEYRIDGVRREVLVAKQPLMGSVSWDDINRAGAALLPESGDAARVQTASGATYAVRLPTCGQSTLGDLSEWNLLIGAVHRGDMDFRGPTYGWIKRPYDDEDLMVGFHGSLSWCQESRRIERVTRGYFFVSRFHAAPPYLRTDRLRWRPVLERLHTEAAADPRPLRDEAGRAIAWSPSGQVGFVGIATHAELFGPAEGIDELVEVEGGRRLEGGQPDWLRFVVDGRPLLVAAKPVKMGVSWDGIAKAGAALGDGSIVRVGRSDHAQGAEVGTLDGTRYRVRLLECGTSTLDIGSEWNRLLGAVHQGDGDFVPYPAGVYAWVSPPMDDQALHVGFEYGSATWCRNTIELDGERYGVNRGYLTISRFHATPSEYGGAGFGWRPVLEPVR
jgi:hypothetical protein